MRKNEFNESASDRERYERVLRETPEEFEARWARIRARSAEIHEESKRAFDEYVRHFMDRREKNINAITDPVLREAARKFEAFD